jgi:hypothetical protein
MSNTSWLFHTWLIEKDEKMNLLEEYKDLDQSYLVEKVDNPQVKRMVWAFNNGYGVSMAMTRRSAIPHAAIIRVSSVEPLNYAVTYNTPITNDTVPVSCLSEAEQLFRQVKRL